jgi:ABC-type transport system involved in multi-copper enzyme maturation permease subunit
MIFRFLRMTSYFFRYSIKSRAFVFIIFMNIVISLLIILLMSSSQSLIKSFVPGNINTLSLPEILKQRLFNFQWANIMIYIPVLSAAFFGSTALPYEYERGTIFTLLSYPVSKTQIIVSKIFGATLLSCLSILVIVAFQLATFSIEFKVLPGYHFLIYVLLLLFVSFSDVCFAVAVSTFFKNSGHSAIAFLIVYLVILDILSLIATDTGSFPAILINTNLDRVIYRVFLNSDPYFLTYTFSLSPISYTSIIYLTSILLVYSVAFILIAMIIFDLRRHYK